MEECKKIGLFVIDSLRYDCIGYQNDKKFLKRDGVLDLLETPTLDEISKKSACFSKCYSTSSLTVQVIASMFTGTTQVNHGIRFESESTEWILNPKTKTLAEILKENGYITVFSCDTPLHFTVPKLHRGFDYDFSEDDKGLFSFLEEHKDEKIFLFTLFGDVHVPYMHSLTPPYKNYNDDYFEEMKKCYKNYNIKYKNDHWLIWKNLFEVEQSREFWLPLYVKGVSKFDKGRLKYFMENLSTCNFDPHDSIMIFTSDHGEGKVIGGKPKHFTHGGMGFEEVVRVPLMISAPSVKPEIINRLTSNIDIFNTVLELGINKKANQSVPYPIYSINPFSEKRDSSWYVFSRRSFHGNPLEYHVGMRFIIDRDKKYYLKGKPEFFYNLDFSKITNKEFLEKIYDSLLGRKYSDKEFDEKLEKLENLSISKENMYYEFLNSTEYARTKSFSMFDLKNDPFEENPIIISRDIDTLIEYQKHIQKMIKLEIQDEYFVNSSNEISEKDTKLEAELRDELEKLGYL